MKKRSVGITAVGYGLTVIYGLGLLIYSVAFVISLVNPQMILQSPLTMNQFASIEDFQRYVIMFWVLYAPQLIGLLKVLQLKESGRRLVMAMNIVACLYIIYRISFVLHAIDARSVSSIMIYLGVIAFFNWSEIKNQFGDVQASQGKKILCVDDDRGLLEIASAILTKKGFIVYTARTGEEGLVMAQKKKPDLVILDVLLPGIKGRDVCAKLKADAETKDIPVIFLSAKKSQDDLRAEMELGAIAHFSKPIDFKELLSEIHIILDISQR